MQVFKQKSSFFNISALKKSLKKTPKREISQFGFVEVTGARQNKLKHICDYGKSKKYN
jgi:hypothetical protein